MINDNLITVLDTELISGEMVRQKRMAEYIILMNLPRNTRIFYRSRKTEFNLR